MTTPNYTERHEGSVEYYYYFVDGDRYIFHRLDGPAIELKEHPTHPYNKSLIRPRWYYMGERIDCTTQEEFEVALKMMAFW